MTSVALSRGRTALLAAVATTAVLALAAPQAQAADAPQPAGATATAFLPLSFTSDVCSIVGDTAGEAAAATKLIKRGGEIVGALLGQLVVTAVDAACQDLLPRGIGVVRRIFARPRPTRTRVYSPLSTYDALGALRVASIASRLGVTSSYVLTARDNVCSAANAGRNAADAVARAFPRARLRHLEAMNAFIRLVVENCSGLTSADANFVTGAVLNLVLANSYNRDLDPPAVNVYRTAGSRSGSVGVVTAWFQWFDSSGIRSCDVQLWYDGAWHPRSGGCSSHTVSLRAGTRYAWAYRATDPFGHVSQWATTSLGTA
jgi:hypothetical protein